MDKIINKVSKHPTKKTNADMGQLISIIPTCPSTPTEVNNTHSATKHPTDSKEIRTSTVPTCSSAPIEDSNIRPIPVTITTSDNTPEERKNIDEQIERIHIEEGEQDDTSALSSISSLNTADIGALDKIFEVGRLGGGVVVDDPSWIQPSIQITNLNTVKLYCIYIYIYIYIIKKIIIISNWKKTHLVVASTIGDYQLLHSLSDAYAAW